MSVKASSAPSAPAAGTGSTSGPPPSSNLAPTSTVLARLERELRDLWTEKPHEAPKSRVCTMNLIVIVPSRDVLDRYTAVIDDVTSLTPARAILVALEPDSPSALDGDVSAVCAIAGKGQLCSERVRLIACGSVCARVASAVEALAVPELTTALVWLGRIHVDDPVFASLARDAQRVVLDTEYTSLSSLMKLARWCRDEPGRPAPADLAWTRLTPWQELCARFFDGASMREHVHRITRLSLKQASEPGARLGSEGTLLLAWMATRLGWKTSRIGGALRFKRPDGGYVAVQLGSVPLPRGVAPAALAYVSIEAEAGGVAAKGTIERDLASGLAGQTADADLLSWKLDVALPSATEQSVRLGANKAATLLERTLHRPANDPALNESIAFAEQIFEDGLTCS